MTARVTPVAVAGRLRVTVPKAARAGTGYCDPTEGVVVSALRCSRTFALAVDVYQRHRRDAGGRCQTCTTTTCRSRAQAATTIEAAGENPADFDMPVHVRPGQRRRPLLLDVRPRSASAGRSRTRPLTPTTEASRPRTPVALAKGTTMPIHVVDSMPFPLRGLLYCACGQPFSPSGWTEDTRTYLSLCGCRLRPIDANAVERRVHAEAELISASSTVDGFSGVALARLYSRIEVGGTVEDIRLLRRT